MILYEDDINRLEQIREYINSNLDKDLKTKTIANKFSIEEHTLRRHFNQRFKLTVHKYILVKRMVKAYDLLLNKQMSVYEVAMAVGYLDRSTFSHAFFTFHSIAPKDIFKNGSDE